MMKKLMVGLVLVGGFLLVSHLTYAQDAQPTAGSDNSVNQADSNNPSAADIPSDAQANSVNSASDSGNNQ
jgi:hypothetical protein